MDPQDDEVEVTKERFKELYFKYGTSDSGWTKEYWNQFYEGEEGKAYYFWKPAKPESNRMFIIADGTKRRMIFLTEESEESFFDFPGKE